MACPVDAVPDGLGRLDRTPSSSNPTGSPRPGALALTFVSQSWEQLPQTPQKRRHRRHLLAAKALTNDDVLEDEKQFEATLAPIITCE
jgi:hypothetical protein